MRDSLGIEERVGEEDGIQHAAVREPAEATGELDKYMYIYLYSHMQVKWEHCRARIVPQHIVTPKKKVVQIHILNKCAKVHL